MISEFTIGAVKWQVVIDSERLYKENRYAETDFDKNKVFVCTEINGVLRDIDAVEQDLYHEVTHAILFSMGENKLCNNETFVQTFSLLLHQFDKTKR